MITFVTILHIVLCFFLILVVLLQAGKGSDMGAAFGGASQTVFGATGAMTLLHKVTTVTAVLFMLTSLGLAWNSSQEQSGGGLEDDIFDEEKQRAEDKEAAESGELTPAGEEAGEDAAEQPAEEATEEPAEEGAEEAVEEAVEDGTEEAEAAPAEDSETN